jgi:beta-barrel assembly-enhancing protease
MTRGEEFAKMDSSLCRKLPMKAHALRCLVVLVALTSLSACVTTPPPRATAPAAPVDPAVAEEARRQTELAIRQEVSEIARLHSVFWPIARAAAPLCPERAVGTIGALPGSLLFLREAIRPTVRRLLGMDERLTFTEVVGNTPMERAGIKPGDVLTHVDGVGLPVSREASRAYQEALNKALKDNRPVKLSLDRQGTAAELTVVVEPTCALGALPMAGDQVTAFAVNRSVWVTRGMMRFASDADLAIVVGHEVAHIALGHTVRSLPPVPTGSGNAASMDPYRYDPRDPWRQASNAPAASPAPAASTLTPQQRELDADTVGVYLSAAAGLPYADAANFWRRMAAQYPSTIQGSHLRSHPASSERFVELERATSKLAELMAQASTRAMAVGLRDGKSTAPIVIQRQGGAVAVAMINERYTSSLAKPGVPVAATNKPVDPGKTAPALTKAPAILLANAITPDRLPYVDGSGREAYRLFLTKVTPRAFALSANGLWASAWGGTDPTSRALVRCAEKGGIQCQLFAVNNEVVWKGEWPDAVGDQ